MNILHTIGSLNAGSGGTSTCTYELVAAMNAKGYPVNLLTLRPASQTERMLGEDAFIHALPHDAITPLAISRNLRRALAESDYDLYHTNGLWMDVNNATCTHARKTGKSCIFSLHGMLYPQALAISSWKKKLMLTLGHRRDLEQAACIHVTCKQEMEHCRAFGLKHPIAVIPNPVQIPSYLNKLQKSDDGIFRVGFLGRFHPIKNIEAIIRAWAERNLPDDKLLLYGDEEGDFVSNLKVLTLKSGVCNVHFTGFVNSREKYEALAMLDVLCAPSHQANFSMSIAEALLVCTPVMALLCPPWLGQNTHLCGWWRGNSVDFICEYIKIARNMLTDELNEMGRRGRFLILASYSSQIVVKMMVSLYDWLLGKNEKTSFVYG